MSSDVPAASAAEAVLQSVLLQPFALNATFSLTGVSGPAPSQARPPSLPPPAPPARPWAGAAGVSRRRRRPRARGAGARQAAKRIGETAAVGALAHIPGARAGGVGRPVCKARGARALAPGHREHPGLRLPRLAHGALLPPRPAERAHACADKSHKPLPPLPYLSPYRSPYCMPLLRDMNPAPRAPCAPRPAASSAGARGGARPPRAAG
jgi:hypothetical protein